MPPAAAHYVNRAPWLRAAVLGANDGLISTASLVVGIAASSGGRTEILAAACAGWAAGALSMAAGEFVSVSSQADLEQADLDRERRYLAREPQAEAQELTDIYIRRGLSPDLARAVADQFMAKDALAAHARDELGLSDETSANPILAAGASAASFSVGAALPTLAATLSPTNQTIPAVAISTLICLVGLGALGAWLGGAGMAKPAARVGLWGAIAMSVTAGIGALVGRAL